MSMVIFHSYVANYQRVNQTSSNGNLPLVYPLVIGTQTLFGLPSGNLLHYQTLLGTQRSLATDGYGM